MKDILSQEIKLFIIATTFAFFSCGRSDANFQQITIQTVGPVEYNKIYRQATDSLNTWSINKVGYYANYGHSKKIMLDSLMCLNSEGNRLVSCLLMQQWLLDGTADDINFFYGEKINAKWYFFIGENIFLPRTSIGEPSNVPMSFFKLHQIALKEVFSGYLDSYGNINEDWFKRHFENVGMCAECKTREDFQQNILKGVAAQWANRDTTQPIKRLEKQLP